MNNNLEPDENKFKDVVWSEVPIDQRPHGIIVRQALAGDEEAKMFVEKYAWNDSSQSPGQQAQDDADGREDIDLAEARSAIGLPPIPPEGDEGKQVDIVWSEIPLGQRPLEVLWRQALAGDAEAEEYLAKRERASKMILS